MPPKQKRLFKQSGCCGSQRKVIRNERWYYLHCLIEDEMLCINDGGDWEWRAHDTINDTPHLYANQAVARQCAYNLKRGIAKTYRWKK